MPLWQHITLATTKEAGKRRNIERKEGKKRQKHLYTDWYCLPIIKY